MSEEISELFAAQRKTERKKEVRRSREKKNQLLSLSLSLIPPTLYISIVFFFVFTFCEEERESGVCAPPFPLPPFSPFFLLPPFSLETHSWAQALEKRERGREELRPPSFLPFFSSIFKSSAETRVKLGN